MKVKINQILKDVKGENLVYTDTKEPITLAEVLKDACLFQMKDEDSKSKFIRYELFKKILETIRKGKNAELELKTEEVADLKKWVGMIKNPLIMGQAWEMLEGDLETEIVDVPKPKSIEGKKETEKK